jgi:hypothetical protein
MRSVRLFFGFLLMLFGCGSRPGPYQKKDGVWYFGDLCVAEKGPPGFVPLSGPFANSSMAGYYRGRAIPDSDGPSFAALSEHYAKDKRHVFYCDTFRNSQEYYAILHDRTVIMEGADTVTFQNLMGGYARDAARVYFEGVAFPVKDVASFTVLEYSFAKDRFTGYYLQEPIIGSDGPTFTGIDNHYARDKDHVFYSRLDTGGAGIAAVKTVALDGAQPASFVTLDSGYAKSGDIVFYQGHLVHGASAASFTVQTGPPAGADARDDKAIYAAGRKLKALK